MHIMGSQESKNENIKEKNMMMNIPEIKVGIVAVSRDCFPESLSVNRRKALADAYKAKYGEADIYESPGLHRRKRDPYGAGTGGYQKAGCNATGSISRKLRTGDLRDTSRQTFRRTKNVTLRRLRKAETICWTTGDAYCGMLNASYNLKLRNIKAYIPEYPVGTAQECADMIHEFVPIARAVKALSELKIISFGPRPLNFLACNAPIKPLYDLGIEIEENSELDLFEAFNNHKDDERIPSIIKEMEEELGAGIKNQRFFQTCTV